MTLPRSLLAIVVVVALGPVGCSAELSGGLADPLAGRTDGPWISLHDGSVASDGPPASTDGGSPPVNVDGTSSYADGGQPAPDSGPLPPDSGSLPPDSAPPINTAGLPFSCPTPLLSGASAVAKYESFFDQRGRPQTDADMGWTDDPSLLAVINTVRFGPVPASALTSIDALRDAVDFVPEHHNQTTLSNLTLFSSLGLTDSSDAYAKFNPRDYIPATLTRYGHSIMASAFVSWADHEWTKLALARCPDCVDGIVTLSAVPNEQLDKHHDFFKIFEVRFVTDLAVDATNPTDRMKAGTGKVFVSKPFKLLAAVDSSGALQTHISSTFRPFQSLALKGTTIRYRGEIGDHLYNIVQSGDAKIKNPNITGTIAVMIRYAADNDEALGSVCQQGAVPAGTDPQLVCNVLEWGTWRCGPYGPNAKEAVQVCKLTNGDFRWLTNNYGDCSVCNVDPLKGCLY